MVQKRLIFKTHCCRKKKELFETESSSFGFSNIKMGYIVVFARHGIFKTWGVKNGNFKKSHAYYLLMFTYVIERQKENKSNDENPIQMPNLFQSFILILPNLRLPFWQYHSTLWRPGFISSGTWLKLAAEEANSCSTSVKLIFSKIFGRCHVQVLLLNRWMWFGPRKTKTILDRNCCHILSMNIMDENVHVQDICKVCRSFLWW